MSDINKDQLQIDYNQVDTDPVVSIVAETESAFDKMLRDHGITEKELDDYSETRGCSYDEAFRHFGISQNELDVMQNNNNSADSLSESVDSVQGLSLIHI